MSSGNSKEDRGAGPWGEVWLDWEYTWSWWSLPVDRVWSVWGRASFYDLSTCVGPFFPESGIAGGGPEGRGLTWRCWVGNEMDQPGSHRGGGTGVRKATGHQAGWVSAAHWTWEPGVLWGLLPERCRSAALGWQVQGFKGGWVVCTDSSLKSLLSVNSMMEVGSWG